MVWLYVFLFLISCALLYFAGKWLIKSLLGIARFLGWREFVVAFFTVAFGASVPNFFVGISSALHKIPQLSFGEIVGGNLFDLTVVVAAATLLAKTLPADSRTVQTSAIFTALIAILPLILTLDGYLGRGDGIILVLVFIFYLFWLFSKKERFTRLYQEREISEGEGFKNFLKDLGKVILGIAFLLLAAEGIVRGASFFAESLNLPLGLIGILIVGLGNAFPETYFAIMAAKRANNWMILGDLMGSVIVPSSLVLGIVAFIHPIKILDFSPYAIGRFFLFLSALFFFIFVRTDRKITKREAFFLLGIYLTFLLTEILRR